jgi:hypothetical protein
MHIFLSIFIKVLSFVLPFVKPLAFMFLLKILETFLCLLLVPHIKIDPLLDVHQLQIPFVKILTHLVNIWFFLIIFYRKYFLVVVAFCVLVFFCLA